MIILKAFPQYIVYFFLLKTALAALYYKKEDIRFYFGKAEVHVIKINRDIEITIIS